LAMAIGCSVTRGGDNEDKDTTFLLLLDDKSYRQSARTTYETMIRTSQDHQHHEETGRNSIMDGLRDGRPCDDNSSSLLSDDMAEPLISTAPASPPPPPPLPLPQPLHHPDRSAGSAEGTLLEQFLFFMSGLGSSLGYIATLSSLVYLRELYGSNSFVYLNLAVYLPLLPISVGQARYDQQFDLYHSTRTTFLFRSVVGFLCILLGTYGLMVGIGNQIVSPATQHTSHDDGYDERQQVQDEPQHAPSSFIWVIFCSLLQGTGGAILLGQLNQLATFVGDSHNSNRPDEFRTGSDNEIPAAATINADSLPRKFKATVSAGVQASALAVLAASAVSGFGTMNGEKFVLFMGIVNGLETLCFIMSLWLLLGRPRVVASMRRRDVSIQVLSTDSEIEDFTDHEGSASGLDFGISSSLSPQSFQLGANTTRSSVLSSPSDAYHPRDASGVEKPEDSSSPHQFNFHENEVSQLSYSNEQRLEDHETLLEPSVPSSGNVLQSPQRPSISFSRDDLWRHSRSCCFVMALTLIPSFLVGSWFTNVQTNWMELAQILFYVRIGSDLVGRLATIIFPPSSSGSKAVRDLLWLAGLRWGAVLIFFLNSSKLLPIPRSFDGDRLNNDSNDAMFFLGGKNHSARDYLSIVLVGSIAFFSGYLVTSCYQLAPLQLPIEVRPMLAAKQASLLTVAFSVSAITGLVTSFVLVEVGL